MTRFFVRHPVSTWMIFTIFIVLGAYALPKMQIEAIPEVNLPSLTITTTWNGASPQAVQRSITLPIEETVRAVHGVESVKSTSRSGRSEVEVEFRREIDIDFARLEVNEQLGSVRRSLPLNAAPPIIQVALPEEFRTEEFLAFSLESDLDPNELNELSQKWIIPRLLTIEGIANASVQGGAHPLIKIVLDRQKLELLGLRADEVFQAVESLDDLSGAGAVRHDGLEKLVSLRDAIDLERLRHAVVTTRGGRVYTLADLGEVRKDHEDASYFVRANGLNVVQVVVEKRSSANAVTVSRHLRQELPRIRDSLPFAATFHIDEDQGKDLESKLFELITRSAAILGILFLLLIASLRQWRPTIIVTGSILFAIVISLSLYYFFHISVNFITICGLTISFGELMDNSILVLDSIHRRLETLEKGRQAHLSRRTKYKIALEMVVQGTREVVFPIIATTLTTVVTFLSFIFLSGRLALYYVPLAVSVTIAMIASLFVAFAWIPVALNNGWAAAIVRRSPDGSEDVFDPKQIHAFVEERHDLSRRLGILEHVFIWKQRLWYLVVPVVAATLVWGVYFVYKDKVIKGGFWRLPDPQELFLYLEMPPGTDLVLATQTLKLFEDELGPIGAGVRMRSTTFDYRGFIRMEFEDGVKLKGTPQYYRDLWVALADRTGGVSIFIRGFADQPYFKGPFAGSSLNSLVRITGYNSRQLNELAQSTLKRIQRERRVRNARITSGIMWGDRAGQDETVLTLRRERLAQHGLTVVDVLGHVRRLLGVDTPWTMLVDGEQEQVQLAYDDSDTISYSDVAQATITTPSGGQVHLGDLVQLESEAVPSSVIRENQRYALYVNWEYVGTDKMRQSYLQRVIRSLDLPYGFHAEEARQEFITEEEHRELNEAAGLAVVFLFVLLAAMFESVSLTLLVLLSIPMSLAGVFIAFWITSSQFDSSARIGLVLLFGIAVKNAILLAARFRTEASLILKEKLGGDPEARAALFPGLRKQLGGSDLYVLEPRARAALLRRAVATATVLCLRPILLTSGTTVVGLLPLLLPMPEFLADLLGGIEEGQGKDIWENLALASVGGILSSMILLLVALPPLYYASVRTHWILRRVWETALRPRLFATPRAATTEPGST